LKPPATVLSLVDFLTLIFARAVAVFIFGAEERFKNKKASL
jgi:hypothetical protein